MPDIIFPIRWLVKGRNTPLALTQRNLLAWYSNIQLWLPARHQHMIQFLCFFTGLPRQHLFLVFLPPLLAYESYRASFQ